MFCKYFLHVNTFDTKVWVMYGIKRDREWADRKITTFSMCVYSWKVSILLITAAQVIYGLLWVMYVEEGRVHSVLLLFNTEYTKWETQQIYWPTTADKHSSWSQDVTKLELYICIIMYMLYLFFCPYQSYTCRHKGSRKE